MTTLYPTLEADLACPSRYVRTQLHKEPSLAPFASTALGKEVHGRIATSLRLGLPVNQGAFRLPRRVMLSEGEKLDDLLNRAQRGLARFEADYRPNLEGEAHRVEAFVEWKLELDGKPVRFVGKLDLLLGQEIWDWKTGNPGGSREQLRLYLFLAYGATGNPPRLARAVGLESGEEVVEPWSEEIIPWGYARLRRMQESLCTALANPKALNPGRACRYCPYAHACSASQAPGRYLLDTRTGEVTELAAQSLVTE
ncbi:PD-(D/E)XK nuclease superfamily protein [Meiothermus luteus]|uniref:PD-(D/E)XK nuclease superfamily protein n=1 Tax=Meiothermus luteus TaxID=2026184 RepID=A0A399EX49_9DEIN|nr:PD-(D/E)XK nuclease family protein [Meiothermus luteus]RIH88263.1 PD-(D/E)XK nuclease superfamily protein [Meiothermus luteus]